ncbi:MAG TPA: DUF2232 domain-containing protein [Candidatus Limnocylindria bacterium]|nr:DUF2232 domain-containing protein [Candidatus Limnocylindria bacterium]
MTSTAEPGRERIGGSWFRILLVIAVLCVLSQELPAPWGSLWLVVPSVVALALLLSWRFGAWGVAVPLGLFTAAIVFVGPFQLWVWWIPVAALTGTWMGLREEGGAGGVGQLAWMLLPLLLLAALLPWMLEYAPLVSGVEKHLRESNQRLLAMLARLDAQGDRTQALRQAWAQGAELQRRGLPLLLPTVLFAWMTLLVVAGRGLAARFGRVLRWPELSRVRFVDWRLPDGAIWLAIVGLALLLAPLPAWAPTGWTLLIGSGLGYCAQGIAVVESLLLSRGVPPSMIVLTMVFVFAMATPVFLFAATCVGVSDLWLDYRRLEAVPEKD